MCNSNALAGRPVRMDEVKASGCRLYHVSQEAWTVGAFFALRTRPSQLSLRSPLLQMTPLT